MVGACAVVVVLAAGALEVARAVSVSHRARAAADLAALGAATALSLGATAAQACGRAADLSARNSARLSMCVASGGQVDLVAVATSDRPWQMTASARSRAGPAPVAVWAV